MKTFLTHLFAHEPRAIRDPRPGSKRTRLSLDDLEDRSVPSIDLVNGVVYIVGSGSADTVTVSYGNNSTVRVVWEHEGQMEVRSAVASTVTKISFSGGGGEDSFENTTAKSSYVDGGAGADILKGGSGADRLYGGDGNDELLGGSGGDYLEGGLGKDILRGGGNDDWLVGCYPEVSSDHLDAGNYLYGDGGNDELTGSGGATTWRGAPATT